MNMFNKLLLLLGLRQSAEATQSVVEIEEQRRKRRGEIIDDELRTVGRPDTGRKPSSDSSLWIGSSVIIGGSSGLSGGVSSDMGGAPCY